jgi:hypothetical protein
MVGARIATHMTSAMPQTFANPMVDVALFPVTQPIDRIVAGLNAYQPPALMGYPSMLARLGVPDPAVEVHRVDRLERRPTGKVRRFSPLTGAVEVARWGRPGRRPEEPPCPTPAPRSGRSSTPSPAPATSSTPSASAGCSPRT